MAEENRNVIETRYAEESGEDLTAFRIPFNNLSDQMALISFFGKIISVVRDYTTDQAYGSYFIVHVKLRDQFLADYLSLNRQEGKPRWATITVQLDFDTNSGLPIVNMKLIAANNEAS